MVAWPPASKAGARIKDPDLEGLRLLRDRIFRQPGPLKSSSGRLQETQDQEAWLSAELVILLRVEFPHALGGQRLDDPLDEEPGIGGGITSACKGSRQKRTCCSREPMRQMSVSRTVSKYDPPLRSQSAVGCCVEITTAPPGRRTRKNSPKAVLRSAA